VDIQSSDQQSMIHRGPSWCCWVFTMFKLDDWFADVYKVQTTSMIRLNTTGFRRRSCLRLPWTWSFDIISMSRAHIHDPILVKLAQMITKILYSPCFRVIAYCDLHVRPNQYVPRPDTYIT